MTKAEAIELVDERMCFGRGKWSEHHMPEIDDYWKAGEMAIKALKQPERKKGEWTNENGADGWNRCSVCGELAIDLFDYCPNCGADMREGEKE